MDSPIPHFYQDRNSPTHQRGGFQQHRGNSNFQPYRRNNNRNWNQNQGNHNNQRKSFEKINVESYFHSSFFEDPWADLIKAQPEPINEMTKPNDQKQKAEEQHRDSDSN